MVVAVVLAGCVAGAVLRELGTAGVGVGVGVQVVRVYCPRVG